MRGWTHTHMSKELSPKWVSHFFSSQRSALLPRDPVHGSISVLLSGDHSPHAKSNMQKPPPTGTGRGLTLPHQWCAALWALSWKLSLKLTWEVWCSFPQIVQGLWTNIPDPRNSPAKRQNSEGGLLGKSLRVDWGNTRLMCWKPKGTARSSKAYETGTTREDADESDRPITPIKTKLLWLASVFSNEKTQKISRLPNCLAPHSGSAQKAQEAPSPGPQDTPGVCFPSPRPLALPKVSLSQVLPPLGHLALGFQAVSK